MDLIIAELNKQSKANLFTKGLGTIDCSKIPFTSPRMNYCTHGGLPENKVIEFFGVEHGGKTTTAMDIVANFQARERQRAEENPNYVMRNAFWADIENAFDREWATKLGIDIDELYYFHPEEQYAEEILDFIKEILIKGKPGLIVIDSIAAMTSKDAMEKSFEEKSFGGISAILSRFSTEITGLCGKYKCTLIGINQVRDDVNSTWGGYKTPGGRAWRHTCSVRMDFRKGKFIDENGRELANNTETPNGTTIAVSMIKNRYCPPDRRTGFYTLTWNGIDYYADLVEVALKVGVIEKSGAWFTAPGIMEEKVQGQHGIQMYFEEHPDILKQVEDLVDERIS